MLKNKVERKEFLLNDDNWETIYVMPELFMEVASMNLGTNAFLIRFTTKEIDLLEKDYHMGEPKPRTHTEYRIVCNDSLSYVVSMTDLIDLLTKIK